MGYTHSCGYAKPSTIQKKKQRETKSLLDFCKDLGVTEDMVLLQDATQKTPNVSPAQNTVPKKRNNWQLTSSPTLIELPPQPGKSTRSPALTFVGTTFPLLSGAPGPTAITVASGKGLFVELDGRKMPVAVFYRSQ